MSKTKRILITDDNLFQLNAMSRLFSSAGYDLLTAQTGAECLRLAAQQPVDLILLDVVLPDIDGLEVCRQLKANPRLHDSYVILFSGIKSNSDDQAEGLDAGADGYIARPIPNRELVARVQSLLRLKQAEEELRSTIDQMEQQSAEKEALLQGARAVLQYREFQDSARVIFDVCKNLIGAKSGYVALLSPDGAENEVLFLEAGGLPCTVDPLLPMPIRGLRAQAYHSGQAVYDNDFSRSQWMVFMPEGHVPLYNVLFAPLTIKDKPVGLIGLANKTGGFVENDARIASAFGDLASIALLNSRTFEALEKSEQTLRTYADQLEERVAERTQALEQAHQRLLSQERLATLGQLAGSIAHELRNPLGAISNTVYLLNLLLEPPDPQVKEMLGILSREIVNSERIINNLLDFARLRQPGQQPVDLNLSVTRALSRLEVPNGVTVNQTLADLPSISADEGLLHQIWINLLLNALQAMPKGGRLTIESRATGGGRVTVSITDTGTGILPENLPRIFEPLFTTRATGIGLGLPLVKMLVEAHGGTIHVESVAGQGSAFSVELPAASQVTDSG